MRHGNVETLMGEVTATARDVADLTRERVVRAGASARERAGVMSVRARGLAGEAAEALEAWTSGAQGVLRARPLYVLALAIGLGYMLGRALRRG
jgi:hypothetical protein